MTSRPPRPSPGAGDAARAAVTDPHAAVAAPVRHALEFLYLRGAAAFAVAAGAVAITAVAPSGELHVVGHLALPAVLLFVVVARIVHVAVRREPYDGTAAWARAAAIDPGETRLAVAVALVVPIAWLVGGLAILWHHTADRAGLAAVISVWLPFGAVLWLAATVAWAADCRERLARAHVESERRFRAYWAGMRPED